MPNTCYYEKNNTTTHFSFLLLLLLAACYARTPMPDTTMTQDAPRTNGVAKTASAADAPRAAALPRRSSKTALPEICYTLRRKLITFLDGKYDDRLLQDTQDQVRVAMGVIDGALQTYGSVLTPGNNHNHLYSHHSRQQS